MSMGNKLQDLKLIVGMKIRCLDNKKLGAFITDDLYVVDSQLTIKSINGHRYSNTSSLFEIVKDETHLREIKVDVRASNGNTDQKLFSYIKQILLESGGVVSAKSNPKFIIIDQTGCMTWCSGLGYFNNQEFKEVKFNFTLDYTIEEVDNSKRTELSSIISSLEAQLNIAKDRLEKL